MKRFMTIYLGVVLISACHTPPSSPPPDPNAELVEKGRQIDDHIEIFY